ncbi:cysteine--tRNA ligase [Chromatiales bacterium (ex Bugula neritina AB1)]|nr:cysteine--tRNA ligase [Chromatiales bacterium (ex Bugula neritina AB1)]
MTIKLYDTYARETREFIPISSEEPVGLYCCGPTVYNYAHIGNLRTYIFEDVLRRVLEYNHYDVRHVVNITDVGHLVSDADDGEDKMAAGAARTGKTAWEIAEIYTDAFLQDLAHLNIKTPDILCKATDHIAEQITAIQQIEAKGLCYITSDGVYFDTSKDPDYGYLARLDTAGLQEGARVDKGEKRNHTDFALWKFSPANEQRQMEWESPWGKGFPGWHIECSAMASKYLGPLFDIHCGGKDHIPIHHSNEIAQAQACYGTRLSNYWMHGYFLQSDKSKMSKSSGEFLRMETLIDKGYDPLTYRFFCLLAHYRSDIAFSWENLDSAAIALGRLRDAFYSWESGGTVADDYAQRFGDCINDDLNTSQAIALVWELVKNNSVSGADKKATLVKFDEVLGLQLSVWEPAAEEAIPDEIISLAQTRQNARKSKDWDAADAARNAIAAAGYEVVDTADGFEVKKS